MGITTGRMPRGDWVAMMAAAWVATSVQAADVAYGALAPGAVSYSEVSGVHAEICRDHLFDRSFAKVRLPTGYRLVSAAKATTQDAPVASLLKRDDRYGAYVAGSLCFMSVDRFVVDGVSVHPQGPTPMAFWWARAERDAGGTRDARMLGKVEWVQLASWYARGTDHTRIIATDPMAQFVELHVRQTEIDHWHLRLVLANEVVTAEVRVSGEREKRNAPQPGFMTVPFTGDSASLFTVFTYFGHHHRQAEGTWEAKGSGVFSDALRISDKANTFETFFQEGWQARSGLYEVGPPDAQQGVPADGPRSARPAAERRR